MSPRRPPTRPVRGRPGRPTRRPPADDAAEQTVELGGLARQSGLRVALVRRYVEFGLVEPCAGTAEAPLFTEVSASRLARAERLRRDLGLNYAGAVLVCELLDRIETLEERIRRGGSE